MQTVAVNGTELAYQIDGESRYPWLVLSNSLAADHRMWAPQMETLMQSHQVLRYDTRGHGQSATPSGDYSFAMLVDDLIGLMDALDIVSADVLGLSLGGMTALGLALDHPARVDRLICCDARADAPPSYAEGWRQRIEIARNKGLTELVDGTVERWLTEPFRSNPANQDTVELARDMILKTSIDGFCGCAAALTALDYAPKLSSIGAPVLFIAGQDDLAAPPDVMAAMADSLTSGHLEIIENAAHLANLNQPQSFNKIVSHWLAG